MRYPGTNWRYLFLFAVISIVFLSQSCEKTEDPETGSSLGTVLDYDGNSYFTKQLGKQWWMINNLRTTHYADGTEIPLVESIPLWEALGLEEKAYCFYNNDENNESQTFGALYTWAAAMNGAPSSMSSPSHVQGVCPDGWHLPSDQEWKELEMFLGMTEPTTHIIGLRGTNEGSKLASSAERWLDGYLDGNAEFGSSGFNAQPGGGRRYNGSFGHLGDNANFWTSTAYSNFQAWGRHIYSDYSSMHRYRNAKSDGFSVRCVKDH